jgi:asparagine synthase (glutamine-hydrolysing)
MIRDADAWKLAIILRAVISEEVSGRKNVAIMFSGGLDSAVIAVIARKYCEPTLYTMGLEGSHDLEWARECAAVLDMPWKGIVTCDDDIKKALGRVQSIHGMKNPKWMTTFVGFDIALGGIAEETVICGQGADELFGGYQKYLGADDAEIRMKQDLDELRNLEFPAYQSMAMHFKKQLLAPYLDERFVRFADTIDIEQKIGDRGNKIVLRDAAGLLGVPGMMANKPKKAMQYGSGISKVIKKHLKNNGNGNQGLM